MPLDLIDFSYRLDDYVAPLYTAYRPPACKLRKWLMRNYICSLPGYGVPLVTKILSDTKHDYACAQVTCKRNFDL